MGSFQVLFFLSLHALLFISSSATRLFHPFSIAGLALIDEAKAQNTASGDKLEMIDSHFESKQFSGTRQIALAVDAKEHPEARNDGQEVSETNDKSKPFPSSSKRVLIEEAREAIRASILRNNGIPFESKRLSPGGPDPHHH